jgi:hypothetical protein
VSSRLAFFSVSAGRCTYCLGFGLLLTNFFCLSCLEAAALPTPTSHRNRSHIAGTSCHERTTPCASTASPVSHPSPLADDVQHATLRALALLSSQFLGSCLAVRGKRRVQRPKPNRVCDGNGAGCYSHLLHAHAARRLLVARAPREPRDRTSHKQTRRAGQPMGLIKSNAARRSWRLSRLDWLVSMPIGPRDLAPTPPIRRAG